MPYGNIGPSPLGHTQRGLEGGSELDEELIPTAIVIKNIPFAVRKEQLVELMTQMNLPLPYAFNYHFDNGVFRGLAFANFTSADETAIVIEHMNHYELHGRRLRVEYKKMLPLQERERIEREKRERRGQLEEQHRPVGQLHSQPSMSSLASHRGTTPSPIGATPEMPGEKAVFMVLSDANSDLNDPETLQFYTQLFMFKEDTSRDVLVFPASMAPAQRRIVHTLAHHMQLEHLSRGNGDQRQLHVFRLGAVARPSPPVGANIQSLRQDDASAKRASSRGSNLDEPRSGSANPHDQTLRAQQSSGLLSIPDAPPSAAGFGLNLRAAKSVADLRTYTPSPAHSTASFSQNLMSNVSRYPQDGVFHPPGIAPPGAIGPDALANGFSGLALRNVNAESPRRLRSTWSWDQDSQQSSTAGSSAGAIGSNRGLSSTAMAPNGSSNGSAPSSTNPNSATSAPGTSLENGPRDRSAGPTGPLRQPHGPPERNTSAFGSRRAPVALANLASAERSESAPGGRREHDDEESRQRTNVEALVADGREV